MIARNALLSKALVFVFALAPQLSSADGFTGADVLEWSEESQNNYFQTSITMIGVVATQTGSHAHIATCIDDWYWNEDGANPENNDTIRAAMRQYPDLYPQAIVLAVVERECGKFSDS